MLRCTHTKCCVCRWFWLVVRCSARAKPLKYLEGECRISGIMENRWSRRCERVELALVSDVSPRGSPARNSRPHRRQRTAAWRPPSPRTIAQPAPQPRSDVPPTPTATLSPRRRLPPAERIAARTRSSPHPATDERPRSHPQSIRHPTGAVLPAGRGPAAVTSPVAAVGQF